MVKSKGLSLIEVLVTLVIIVIGLLGVFTVQINAKRVSYDAEQRSIASNLMLSMFERMRANASALDSYVTPNTGLGNITLTAQCTSSSTCTTQDRFTCTKFINKHH